jgi:hypothetical protein
MKITLSIPSTISRKVKTARLTHAFGSLTQLIHSIAGFHKTISKRKIQLLLFGLLIAHESWSFRLLIVL